MTIPESHIRMKNVQKKINYTKCQNRIFNFPISRYTLRILIGWKTGKKNCIKKKYIIKIILHESMMENFLYIYMLSRLLKFMAV